MHTETFSTWSNTLETEVLVTYSYVHADGYCQIECVSDENGALVKVSEEDMNRFEIEMVANYRKLCNEGQSEWNRLPASQKMHLRQYEQFAHLIK